MWYGHDYPFYMLVCSKFPNMLLEIICVHL